MNSLQVIWWRNEEDWEEKFWRRIPQPRAALGVVSKLPAAFASPKLNRSFRVYHISFYWLNIQVDPTSSNVASAMLNSKIRPRAVVGYGFKIFQPSPLNYVTRSPGWCALSEWSKITVIRRSELLFFKTFSGDLLFVFFRWFLPNSFQSLLIPKAKLAQKAR